MTESRPPSLAMFWSGVALLAFLFVPPSLFGWDPSRFSPQVMGSVLATGVALCIVGLVRFRQASAGDPVQRKRGVRALVAFIVLSVGLTGGVFAASVYWWDAGRALCREGQRSPQIEDRRRLLHAANPYRERIAFFNEDLFTCTQLQEELERFDADGVCPSIVPMDVECSCGDLAFPADSPGDGPTECSPFGSDGNGSDWVLRPR